MTTALILGASGTLGGAIARELLGRGYALGLHYRSHPEACEELAAQARDRNLQSVCYAADFRDPSAPAALATAFLKDFPRLDALVWAAGIVHDAPLLTLKEEELRAQLDVDLKAPFLVLKAFSRQFIKQKSGTVAALSSHAGIAGRAGGWAYAMAQAGLISLVKSAAREWGPLGMRVNAVLPPFVPDSGMGRASSPQFVEAAQARRALKTDADGAVAVAKFVAELIENPVVSGQVLSVDSRVV